MKKKRKKIKTWLSNRFEDLYPSEKKRGVVIAVVVVVIDVVDRKNLFFGNEIFTIFQIRAELTPE